MQLLTSATCIWDLGRSFRPASAIQQKHSVSHKYEHIHNLNFLYHIKKTQNRTDEINLVTYYTWPNISKTFQHLINIKISVIKKNKWNIRQLSGLCMYSICQWGLATFQMPNNYLWLMAATLNFAGLSNKSTVALIHFVFTKCQVLC